MSMLFSQKEIMEIHDFNLVKAARHAGREEGQQEGMQKGGELEFLRMANLSKALAEAGREHELSMALMDRALYQRLLKEFGL